MIDYEQAIAIILDAAPVLPAEDVVLADVHGRVLARTLHSPAWLPPFDNAAMDGFALACGGTGLAAATEATVHGSQAAGAPRRHGAAGVWEIMTGARMPDGLDTVVPVEQVEVLACHDGRPGAIRLVASVRPGQHVRLRGEDVAAGDLVIAAGQRLLAPQTMLLHALGVSRVAVRRRPRVAVISTGHELVDDPERPLQSGQIRDSNRPFLCAKARQAGAEVVWHGCVDDDPAAYQRALEQALAQAPDLLISSGAVSAGRYDFVPDALRARGAEIGFQQVAIRPGKPLLFARMKEGPLYFGLPGNPVSSAVGQRFFVEPALRAMLGLPRERALRVPLQAALRKPEHLRFHARAVVACDAQGALSAALLPRQEPFRLMPLLAANAWVVAEAGAAELAAGQTVDVHGLGHWQSIQLEGQ
ncbi:MAG: molybdopterin molybdotransferase MoeA [Pseudomonas sp.]